MVLNESLVALATSPLKVCQPTAPVCALVFGMWWESLQLPELQLPLVRTCPHWLQEY